MEVVKNLPSLTESLTEATAVALVPATITDTDNNLDFTISEPILAQTAPSYQPRQEIQLADPSNYGDRYSTDAYGRPVNNEFIAVLHETVGSAQSAINLFQTYHPNDNDQVSYHTLIGRDGTVYYIVPPEKRAYGAGNSVFNGPSGVESVVTNPAFPSSVNNFAYHVSLETPSDGRGNGPSHSGYTQAQYESLAWLLSQSSIPNNRITTHKAVDQSGSRQDPRSFDFNRFLSLLNRYPSRAGL
ncbi:MAG: N-acetylmuramoyl-L-alanine amidase [Leptolyngbya sp. SIO1D8]|nr:N-acetylmuramoyl-L-alanine amidase [Leptolyngbya sp. SIO1D8]